MKRSDTSLETTRAPHLARFLESFPALALRPIRPQTRKDQLAARDEAQRGVFAREVDEAVRQDQLAEAARRFGWPVLIAVVLGVIALGAWLWWQSRQHAEAEQRTVELTLALDRVEAGRLGEAREMLAPLAAGEGESIAVLARLMQAGVALERGATDEAARLFDAVAEDEDAPGPYRDLARIRSVAMRFDALPPDDVIARLKPQAAPGNPWFGSAGELVANAHLKQGNEDLAGAMFAAIAKDETVPETVRSRTRQMAGLLGVDAVVDVDAVAQAGAAQDGAAQAETGSGVGSSAPANRTGSPPATE